MTITDTDIFPESASRTSNTDTIIIVVVFLMLFVTFTAVLVILLCKKGLYYLHFQNMCKKKQPDNVQRHQPGQQYVCMYHI